MPYPFKTKDDFCKNIAALANSFARAAFNLYHTVILNEVRELVTLRALRVRIPNYEVCKTRSKVSLLRRETLHFAQG